MKKGFTILEALIVMSILGILLLAGYPKFSLTLKTIKIKTAAREVCSAFKVTRSYAITQAKDYSATIDFVNNIIWVYETADFKSPHNMATGIDLRDGNNNDGPSLVEVFHSNGSAGNPLDPQQIVIKVLDLGGDHVLNVLLTEISGAVKVQ